MTRPPRTQRQARAQIARFIKQHRRSLEALADDDLDTRTTPERRRVCATYCPICGSWAEVRLRPVRLHCTGCGQEAKP